MRRAILLSLLLFPLFAGAQGFEVPGGGLTLWTESSGTLTWTGPVVGESFTATAVSGQVAYSQLTGSRLALDTGETTYLSSNGSKITATGQFEVSSHLYVVGSIRAQYIYPSSSSAALELKGNRVSTGSAIAVSITNNDPLTTLGDIIAEFKPSDAGGPVARIDILGAYGMDGTDESGTPGAATINKAAGRVAIVAAASTVVVTNSIVTVDSIIVPVPEAVDATCTAFAITPAAGSFTISSTTGVCTATMPVSFVVHPMF